MTALALTVYDIPVVTKNTFLHVDYVQHKRLKRSASSPDVLQQLWVAPPETTEHEAPGTDNTTPETEVRADDDPNDDDAALQEGRSMALAEIWTGFVKETLRNKRKKIKAKFEPRRMKLRCSMKPDGFIQVVKMLNMNETDVVVMRAMGMIRDKNEMVNILLSDEQLKNSFMEQLLQQAHVIQGLSKKHFYLMMNATEVGVVIHYDPNMTMLQVKKSAENFYDIDDNATIQLERLNGEVIKGRTLRKCNVKPGDAIRVVLPL